MNTTKWVLAILAAFVFSLALQVGLDAQARGQQQGQQQAQQPQGQRQQPPANPEQRQRPQAEQERRQQPGATQGGPTTGREMMAPFDPRYLLGDWEIEWNPPDTALFPGGKYTGIEKVGFVANRYLTVDIQLENQDGHKVTGKGIILVENGIAGPQLLRYVVYDTGFALLQPGPVGGDLGGYYSQFWETPEFTFKDTKFALKGRSYYVSPAAYRINQQISINGEAFMNFGIMWLTKDTPAPVPSAAAR